MIKTKKEQEYGEKLRKYFFTFAGCFVGVLVLVFITDLEPRIFFTGFILLIAGFIGFFIYCGYVAKQIENQPQILLAKSINDFKVLKEENRKNIEQDLADVLKAIADKKANVITQNRMLTCGDDSRDRRIRRNKRLDRLDRTLGTSFRTPVWSHRRETK